MLFLNQEFYRRYKDMAMKDMVTVLSARRYEMTDESTGELVHGVIVKYVNDWNGLDKQHDKGVTVLKATMPYEAWDTLPALPADCMATFRMSAGRGDKAMLNIDALDFKTGFHANSALMSPNKADK